MANRQRGRPPHKVGDGGYRREHPGRETFWIGPEISVTVSRFAGRIVTEIKAPREYEIKIDLQSSAK